MKKILLSLFMSCFVFSTAHAASYSVNTADYEFEDDYAADCTPGGSDCSLSEALKLANDNPGFDTIQITPPSISINAILSIWDSVEIVGMGDIPVIIDGVNNQSYALAITANLFGQNTDKQVVFRNLEFINFTSTLNAGAAVIHATGDVRVTLEDTVFRNNTGATAGAVYNNGGELIVNSSLFVNNSNAKGNGGAISVNAGKILVSNSTFDGNRSARNGGAIGVHQGNMVSLANLFIANHAGSAGNNQDTGGGVYLNMSRGIFTQTRFLNNEAKVFGAGLAVVQENVCTPSTYVVCDSSLQMQVRIDQSVFSDNNAVLGAGIYLKDSQPSDIHNISASVINSNVIYNFGRMQFGFVGQGAGIYSDNANLRISYSTIARNASIYLDSFLPGAGIQAVGDKELSIKASIVAENTAYLASGSVFTGTISDCRLDLANKNSYGYNVLGDTCSGLTAQTSNQDRVGDSPSFNVPVEENSLFVALPITIDSPAVDFAEQSARNCLSLPDYISGSEVGIPSDYLGSTRPVGTFCDSGAYELGCSSLSAYYPDADGDSYGTGSPVILCKEKQGYTRRDGDCNDADVFAYTTNSDESCDGHDNNCNGNVDEGYDDTDNNGVKDCLDIERCDGLDNDGNGTIDEGFSDIDGDGVKDCIDIESCDGLDNNGNGIVDEGFADTDGDDLADCRDTESCDGLDNDGNGLVDEGFSDADRDGIADCIDNEECDGIDNNNSGQIDEGFADTDDDGIADCQDTEVCDGLDNNGNGSIDEGFDANSNGTPDCFEVPQELCNGLDDDGDGLIDESFGDTDGDGIADCRDTETCDGIDNNGNGTADEGFADTDGDGTADCQDTESCDGLDNNGNGSIDEGFDANGNGAPDCSEVPVVPTEICNGADDDTDGQIDEGLDCADPSIPTPPETPEVPETTETPESSPGDETPTDGNQSTSSSGGGGGCSLNPEQKTADSAMMLLLLTGLVVMKFKSTMSRPNRFSDHKSS